MIQNQAGALGQFLLKMPKDARPAPDSFSNLRVSATQNHQKCSYIYLFGDKASGYQTRYFFTLFGLVKLGVTLNEIFCLFFFFDLDLFGTAINVEFSRSENVHLK